MINYKLLSPTFNIKPRVSILLLRSSSSALPSPNVPMLRLSRFKSRWPFIPRAPRAAVAEGLSKFMVAVPSDSPLSVCDVAGDFLNCCGDVREPWWGEKAAWVCEFENGVDTGGVGAAPCIWEGVRPCCEGPWRMGVDMAKFRCAALEESFERVEDESKVSLLNGSREVGQAKT
jgi:hypothetical protein